jgi:hypothetical protein
MRSTFLKQVIYGIFYIVIIGGVGYGVFIMARGTPTCFDNRQNQQEEEVDCGGSCVPCALKRLKPITASPVTLISNPDDSLSLFFEVSNANANYGAEKFSYTVTLYNTSGAPETNFSRTSFIYPSEIRTIAEVGLSFTGASIARAEVTISDLVWREGTLFSKPLIETREVSVSVDPLKHELRIQGLVSNKNSFGLARVGIGAIVNSENMPLGVSKTAVTDLAAFEERAFSIFIPWTESASVAVSDVLLFTESVR